MHTCICMGACMHEFWLTLAHIHTHIFVHRLFVLGKSSSQNEGEVRMSVL